MHIAQQKIERFKGANDADIYLGRHTMVIGPNNSGATAIIEALAFLFGREAILQRWRNRIVLVSPSRPRGE